MSTNPEAAPSEKTRRPDLKNYWKANSRLIFVLLVIWALVSVVASILAIQFLNQFSVGQLPAGFWMAQQGAIFVFVILIFIYAFVMDRLDKKYDVEE